MNNKKRYDYVILPSFEKDMREIQDYIIYRLQNPLAADDLVREVEKAIEGRRYFPEAYERYSSQRKRKRPYTASRSKTTPFSIR